VKRSDWEFLGVLAVLVWFVAVVFYGYFVVTGRWS